MPANISLSVTVYLLSAYATEKLFLFLLYSMYFDVFFVFATISLGYTHIQITKINLLSSTAHHTSIQHDESQDYH